MRVLGASIFPIIGGTLSATWLYQAYGNISNNLRYFWLLLCGGVLFYIVSNSVWLYSQLAHGITEFPTEASLFWVLANSIFLVALIYKTQVLSISLLNSQHIFNILVFMIIAVAISIHYLINPILELSNNPISVSLITLTYPITNLSILFVTISLYYLSKRSKHRKVIVFIIIGFFIQVVADSYFIYLSITDNYLLGGMVDPLWLIAILIIGLAGLYAQDMNEPKEENNYYFKSEISIIPYIGVVFLALLVINSYKQEFNALSIGVLVLFLLIIVRQFLVMNQNENLIDEYKFLAHHDLLTGLNNRACFKDDLHQVMVKGKSRNRMVAVLLIDLDRFKNVNDTLGHYIGDCLLKEVSQRLKSSLSVDQLLYRIGGDEFTILLPDTSKHNCISIADIVLKVFDEIFLVEGYEIAITPSIGVSIYPENGEDSETLLQNADAAMYLAKARGKNNFQFYDSDLNEQISRKMELEQGLRKAIESNELTLCYQPKVDLHTGEIIGSEALLRWKHPELGDISPSEFIPIAEETGQIVSIGEWVLRKACKQNILWQEGGFPSLCISVNVSVRQFQHSDFVKIVRNVLQETGLHPQFLELEITESIMQNVKESRDVLKGLRALGVGTSIDDFGTGYSSLHILKELPIDSIKIDKSFIDNIEIPTNLAMVNTIIDIGLNLNLRVIAEGIEYKHQARTLAENKCDFGQGYLFSQPVHAKVFENYLAEGYFLPNL